MLISDLLASKGNQVEVIDRDATIDAAAAQMSKCHVGSLLIIVDDRVAGILTERDVLLRVVAARRDPMTTRVHEAMTRELVVIRPEDTILRAMTVATDWRCRHLPVIDDNRLCGIVSAGDLTAWLVRDQRQTINDLHQYITR